MGLFSKSYEPGGEHHIRITDSVFDEAQNLLASDDKVKKHFKEVASDVDCAKYEAHDFPVTEIIGAFYLSYEIQEERNGVPENLRIGNIQLGRKDQVEYNKFVKKFNDRIDAKVERKQAARASQGVGGMLFSMAAGAAAKGIAKVATGKSDDVRDFEKNMANYLCGDSQKAKDYLLKFATEFGGHDEGVMDVAKAIRTAYWRAEFAKYNRSK